MARDLAHLSDEALVALIARSDDGALEELYSRFGRIAYGLALRVLRDPALAEDAVQDAFLTVWRTAGPLRPRTCEGEHLAPHAGASPGRRRRAARAATGGPSRSRPRRSRAAGHRGRGVAALPAHARPGAPCAAFPTNSGKRSSSRTTAASRRASSPTGSASRSVRSRAGCSRGWRACASYSRNRNPKRNDGTHRDPRAERCVRARRARPEQRAEFEEHLLRCAECRETVSIFQETAAALAHGVEAPAPPPALGRADHGAGSARASEGRLRSGRAGSSRDGHGRRGGRVCGDRAGDLDGDPQQPARRGAPRIAALEGTNGSLIVSSAGEGTLVVDELGAAPAGKTYEAWVIQDGNPLPAGTFSGGGRVAFALTRDGPDGASRSP